MAGQRTCRSSIENIEDVEASPAAPAFRHMVIVVISYATPILKTVPGRARLVRIRFVTPKRYELLKFAPIEPDAATLGAHVEFHARPRDGLHRRFTVRAHQNRHSLSPPGAFPPPRVAEIRTRPAARNARDDEHLE